MNSTANISDFVEELDLSVASEPISDEYKEEAIRVAEELGNSNSIKKYFNQLQRIPLLMPSEEIELARAYRNNAAHENHPQKYKKAIEARNKLVLGNLRLVVSLAKRYMNSRVDLSELIQEGNMGLMKAVEKYDPEMGYRFSTYATWWIRQSILAGISERARLIRLPASINELISKIKKVRETLPKELGREPSLEEIGKTLNVSPQRVANVNLFEEQQDQLVSLDTASQGEEGGEISLLDTICSEQDQSFEESLDLVFFNKFLDEAIKNLLNEREAMIVRNRYGLNDDCEPMTLTELAKILDISLERVRQIELKALNKLRTCFSLQFGDSVNLLL
ncbi:MAG: sigma-70 family RNA polymerase sigma factor [Candidatus Caenarcaniphilales bacterium]|nr:sigma-70 family RNA polymerase sigma factor [Candidatus Caenarcaniphilales bacterium]